MGLVVETSVTTEKIPSQDDSHLDDQATQSIYHCHQQQPFLGLHFCRHSDFKDRSLSDTEFLNLIHSYNEAVHQ